MPLSRICLYALLSLAALNAGCLGSGTPSPADRPSDNQCTEAYAYAPAAYIIHVASGDAVILDPLATDFPLFCTPESAAIAMQKAQEEGRIPAGNWKVFRVYGDWAEIATESSPGVFLLNRAAPLVDWVN